MRSIKEIKSIIKDDLKTVLIKRSKEKSTWFGIITKVASVVGFSLAGVPVDILAGMCATYFGGMLTAANTTKDKEAK